MLRGCKPLSARPPAPAHAPARAVYKGQLGDRYLADAVSARNHWAFGVSLTGEQGQRTLFESLGAVCSPHDLITYKEAAMSVFASSVKSFIDGLIGSPSEDKQDARTNEDDGYPSEVIISDPSDFDRFEGLRQAELELSQARIALKHEAFRARTYTSELKDVQSLLPKHFPAMNPEYNIFGEPILKDGDATLSIEEVMDVTDSFEDILMKLQDCLHDYQSAELDVSVAEWVLAREEENLNEETYLSECLDPIDFEEGYNSYVDSHDDWDGAL